MLARHGQQLVLGLGLAHLGEAGRDHDGAGNALLADLLHGAGAESRRHREDGDVDHAGNVLDALVGLLAQNLVGLGVDRVELARVTAVDDVLHHRVADLALAVGGADDGHRPRVHDAVHGGDDFFLAGPEWFLLRGKIHGDQGVHRSGARGARQYGIEVDFSNLRKVADQLGDVDDDVGKRVTVHGFRAPDAVEHFGGLDAVKHRAGIPGGGGCEPEGDVLEHFHQHAAQAEGHQLAETGVGDRTDDDLLGGTGHHLLNLHAVDSGVAAVRSSARDYVVVRGLCRIAVGDPDHNAPGVGLVKNIRRDNLHDHRVADPVGDRTGLTGRLREPLARHRNAVSVAHDLALRRGQGVKALGPCFIQDGADSFLPVGHGYSLIEW